MTPTAEQQAILAAPPTFTRKVTAFAGCGKTSTLVEFARKWPERGLYLAFNRAIAQEAKGRFPSHVECLTAHAFAYRDLNIGDYQSRLTTKLRFEHLKPFDDYIGRVVGMTPGQVSAAVLRTLQNFLIDQGSKVRVGHCNLANDDQRRAVIGMTAKVAKAILAIRKGAHGFSHDVYLKKFELFHGIKNGQFDYLLIDESQDLNPVLVSIVQKSGLPALVVGDPWQSIYAFRGAINAMGSFDAPDFALSRSWRFGPAIADLANRILRYASRPPRVPLRGSPERATTIERYPGRVQAGTTILARTNARLFDSLAKIDLPFHLVGGIEDLVRQIGSAYALSHGRFHEVQDIAVNRFSSWRAFEEAAERGDGEAKRLRDIVVSSGSELPATLHKLKTLHRDREVDAQIVVSTAHKAKGREWARVVVLDDFEAPAAHAARRRNKPEIAEEADQEVNLLYVACTRATECLYLAPNLHTALAA